MIQRIALAVALSVAPLCAGYAMRAYHNWLVGEDETGGRCQLVEVTMDEYHPTVRFRVQPYKGNNPQPAEVDVTFGQTKIGTLIFSIDGHTFKALHPDFSIVSALSGAIAGTAKLPVEIFDAMRVGKTLRYEYRAAGEEKPLGQEVSLEGFDEAAASCHASTEKPAP
jgi:hypothetical protein